MSNDFETKLPEYLLLVQQDADATSCLQAVEEAFDKIYKHTDNTGIKLAIMHLLTTAQLNAMCANMELHRFIEKNM